MQLFDTHTRYDRKFEPAGPQVGVYVCGITPYDTTHLGHAFTYASADILIRWLEYKGFTINYVQNVTDIDDDILRKAAEVGEDWLALGNRWTAHYIRDMQALNVRPPDHFPRASDVIAEIQDGVASLLSQGIAYVSGGSVYYRVDAWPEFGSLSKIERDQMLPVANERGNRPDDPRKRDPLDFVLWQAQAPGEPAWDSPWGPGRPGWHIECSTLSTRFIGRTIDIHGGGSDLIFPHHECEIAQAEPVTGARPFVRFWLHTAMVEHQGAKMSKSLGNLVMVRDLLQHCTADALRLYMAGHHYRQAWSHDPAELHQAEALAGHLKQAASVTGGSGQPLDAAGLAVKFAACMDDDLNTPAALPVMQSLAGHILSAAAAGASLDGAQAHLRAMARVVGLRLDANRVEPRVQAGWQAHLQRFQPN
jgi:L-cysteine:1D-myo-inositol 2-amino-2-deoxy-alpha-D-glucopyranoside ligase